MTVPIGLLMVLLAAGSTLGGDEVILKSRRFVPAAGIRGHLRVAGSSGRIHVIVQLEGIPTVERRITLADSGVRLLSYIPDRAWLVGIPADKIEQIAALDGVRAVAGILPGDKIAPALREEGVNEYSVKGTGQAKLIGVFFADVALQTGEALIAQHGGRVIARSEADSSIVFYLTAAAIHNLASCDEVKWIDQHCESVDLNDGVRAAIHVDAVQSSPYDLTGAGVVVGQWESRHPDANHVDLAGRVFNVDDAWPIGDHATQVAGTLMGDGSLLADRRYRGMATQATLASFHAWDNVAEFREQYERAISLYGIDIANNSWGKVEWDSYKDYSAAMDDIVRGGLGKPISMVWAAGNEGGWCEILCTAVAKNIVTVGASNSDDNSLWSWSNKGPTEDGRIKPDVVSPGCEARRGGSIWSTLPANRYGGGCGTSLAAPSVSGTMALILEDWRGTHGVDPLPSTLKGILIHTAADLGNPGPDYAYGYGLIDARKAIDLVRADTLNEVAVEGRILQQGQRDVYALDVGPNQTGLKVTLVWDDFPGDPLAALTLVNDLDLVVTGPDGKRHFPWTLNPSRPAEPARRVEADHVNNVEQVYVENPSEGTWLLTVWGTTVPQYDQTYSLLVDHGSLSAVPPRPSVFSVAGRLGSVVAEIDDLGNLILQGALTTRTECLPPEGALALHSQARSIAGCIDFDGNMCICGDLYERSDCEPAGGDFVVRDSLGKMVACVDEAGNVHLVGRLHSLLQP